MTLTKENLKVIQEAFETFIYGLNDNVAKLKTRMSIRNLIQLIKNWY